MNQAKSVFLTLLIGLIALAALDIVFNGGQTIAALMPDTAVSPDNPNLTNTVIDTSQPATVIRSNPLTVTAAPQETAVPTATPTESPTATPAPTRPAIEELPQGEGPYTSRQMQVCRDVWAQNLQGELTTHQFGYCKGVVERDGE
jgi:hypothetical protein